MDYIKKLFGWGDSSKDEEHEHPPSSPLRSPSRRQRAAPPGAAVGGPRPRFQPLLCEVGPGGDGGVQGLDWYRESLKEDTDGDCANEFLQETAKAGGDESGPAPKQRRVPAMQSTAARVKPPKRGGDLVVEHGNVSFTAAGAAGAQRPGG